MKAKTPFARMLRKKQTDAEGFLWSKIRNRQLNKIKFHRQYILGGYILDFVTFEPKLVIELDGSQHTIEENKRKDRIRDAFLISQGFQVLRFWNSEILRNINNVLEVIYMQTVHPSSQPSPKREKEIKE